MRTFTNVFQSGAVLLLLGAVVPAAALAQTRGTGQGIRYAVENGGVDSDGANCWIDAPCTIARAIAGHTGTTVDTVAIRVRRAGDSAILGGVTFNKTQGIMLAVYNEAEATAYPHVVKGNVELRGTTTMSELAALSYSGDLGMLKISGANVSVAGRELSFGGNYAQFNGSGIFQGNVVFTGTTTLTQTAGGCAIFQSLRVASRGKLTLDLSCTAVPLPGASAGGVHVLNILDIRGQLIVENGYNLNILSRRPATKADSALSAPEKLPGAYVSGSITGPGCSTLRWRRKR